jgi:ATP-dependent Clp protease adaptor protein ClpS
VSTDTDTKVNKKLAKKINEPGKYKVIFLNDDKTPMAFVVDLLTSIFKHSDKSAETVMLTVHNEGSGIAGVYSFEIAEQKMHEATTASRDSGFPLKIKMERD